MIAINDIIRFGDGTQSVAGQFCRDKGITGRVIKQDSGMFVVEVGLYYQIYALAEELELVAKPEEAPVPEDL